ncbi:MAG: hypothetical protein JKY66_10050 [Spongiibacteraceae bacterium]|nr:hypothetical protein [Spongiibacteraceae bacterium]
MAIALNREHVVLMISQDSVKLRIPRQELDHCSFFECNEKALQQWVDDLPVANLGETTRKLYQALNEFNQVHLLPEMRMNLLEKLRPSVNFASNVLAKHYLNQPIVLSPQASKVADLANALHHQMATGFTIVATHTAAMGKRVGFSKPDQLIAKALHRAITEHSLNMLRHYQLYEPVGVGVWHNLHQFYRLAKQYKILDVLVVDEAFSDCTVEGNYIRALLIGCAKPNQLRQEDFMEIFKPLAKWADLCKVTGIDKPGLFVIDPTGNRSPVYSELYDTALESHWLSLDTNTLATHIQHLYDDMDKSELKVRDGDDVVSRDLLGHLTSVWSVMSKRTYIRTDADDELQVCVGLSAAHHFVSGELDFDSLVVERGAKAMVGQNENPFLKSSGWDQRNKDVWDNAYTSNAGQSQVSLESIDYQIRDYEGSKKSTSREKYHNHNVQMINSSAHGYCVQWSHKSVAHIKSGEIVGVRQHAGDQWSIGVIRWVSHSNKSQQTQLGLELISPNASPYGARVVRVKGAPAKYLRALVLPGVPAINRPVTLLTARVPFRVGQKVVLNQRGSEIQVSLSKKLNDVGAYSQFEFRKISAKAGVGQEDSSSESKKSDNEFDSLWRSL